MQIAYRRIRIYKLGLFFSCSLSIFLYYLFDSVRALYRIQITYLHSSIIVLKFNEVFFTFNFLSALCIKVYRLTVNK